MTLRVVAGGPAREEASAHHRASRFTLENQMILEGPENPALDLVTLDLHYVFAEGAGYEVKADQHVWKEGAIARVAAQRCAFLKYAKEKRATHALMVDDDVLLPPDCLQKLLTLQARTGAAVVYGAYRTWLKTTGQYWWTVWMEHPHQSTPELLEALRVGRPFEVFGGGALSLFDLRQVDASAYALIPGVPVTWGEDRHMNIRLAGAGRLQLAVASGAHHAYYPEQRAPADLRRALRLFGYDADEVDLGDQVRAS